MESRGRPHPEWTRHIEDDVAIPTGISMKSVIPYWLDLATIAIIKTTITTETDMTSFYRSNVAVIQLNS